MKNSNYSYFSNTQCEMFPCHKCEGESFNCLFCYCPLYLLGEKCGGEYIYTDEGRKDCSKCMIPHTSEGYEYVLKKIKELIYTN